MNLKTGILLFFTLLNISFGLWVYIKNRRSISNITYCIFMSMVGLWSFGLAMFYYAPVENYSVFWSNFLYFMGSSIAVSFFYVSLTLPGRRPINRILIIWPPISLGILFVLFFFTPLMVNGVSYPQGIKTFLYGKAHLLFDIHFCAFFMWAILKLFRALKVTSGIKREQIKYVLLSTFIGVAFNGITNVTMPSIFHNCSLVWIGPYITFIMVSIMTYAIVRYKILDVHFVIRKTITNIILVMAISIIALAILYPNITGLKTLLTILTSSIIAIYLPRLKIKTENMVNHILYKGKYDYLDKLDNFVEKMVLIPKEEDLIKDTAMVLTRDMYTEKAALLIRDYITGDYLVKYEINLDVPSEFKLSGENRIINKLKDYEEVFVLEEQEKMLPVSEIEIIKKELAPLQAKVCIPARLETDLIGLIALGNKTTGGMYTHKDLELLERLGTQLAIALDYKRVESQLRKEQELASIGIMSMEIGHELRNLLQLPQTYIDLSFEKRSDDDFYRDFRNMAMDRMKVIRDKLNDIMYLGKERPLDLAAEVEINSLLDENLIANDFSIKKENIEMIKEYSKVPLIRADKSQLTHLFNNLILNAIDAMKNRGGKLRIRSAVNTSNVTKEMKDKANEWVRIEVKDDGIGIPEQVMKRLFTPFVTTKSLGRIEKSGTGLGLSVVKKVVDAHKGYIHVHTKEGKGTTFVVDLPIELKASYIPVPPKSAGEPWEYKE